MCHYEKDPSDFSLSLIEKAFIKVYGGYDKKVDQNPSIDIHFLTNWIPETVRFDDVNSKDNLWTRLIQNFRDLNIIICLQADNEQTGQSDFYTVLDLIETHDVKLIQCKCAFKGSKKLMKFVKDADRIPMPFKRE
jgi:calpain-7